MAREPRFPGIIWYCDHCGASLSDQKNFDDHKYIWKCTECGFKNSISWDNISQGDSAATTILLHLLGFFSYISLWTAVMFAVALFGFHVDVATYLVPFFISLGLYLLVFIIGLVVEFSIRHRPISLTTVLSVALRNVKEDLLSPLFFIKEIISNILSFITNKLPFSRKYEWYSNKTIVFFAIVYLLLFVLEFAALSKIIHFSLSDWLNLF